MAEIQNDPTLVAFCGLYCGACGRHVKGACPGCAGNVKATWCRIRACCMTNGYTTCADCRDFSDATACKTYNNFIGRVFGFIFRSNRPACIRRIKEVGVEQFAGEMTERKRHSLPR